MASEKQHKMDPALRKRLILTVGGCAAVVVIVAAASALTVWRGRTVPASATPESASQAAATEEPSSADPSATIAPQSTEAPAASAAASSAASSSQSRATPTPAAQTQGGTDTAQDNTPENNTPASQQTELVQPEPTPSVITLPYTIPNTSLVVRNVSGYDGVYLEDGSDSDITGVAAMVVENTGSTGVEYADIRLTQGGTVLEFKVSALPAGSMAVVQEASRQSPASGDYTVCTADVATLDSFGMSEGSVQVTDNGDNSLTVTNISGADIPCVRIFYKYYMSDENAYVGGIAYTAKLDNLTAGQSVTVNPTHYASNGSKVVMVRTYDTSQ